MRDAAPIHLTITGAYGLREQAPVDVLISLWQPDEPRPPLPAARDRLLLDFHDLPYEAPGLRGPEPGDARELRDFARAHVRPGDHVLVHCAVGASRSPAAALAVLLSQGLTPEQAIAEVLRVTGGMALPNPLLVHYIDDAFGLSGALQDAVDEAAGSFDGPNLP